MGNLKLLLQKAFNLNPKSKFGKTNIIAFLTTIVSYITMVYCTMPLMEEHWIVGICVLAFFLFSFPFMLLLGEVLLLLLMATEVKPLHNGVAELSWKNIFTLLKAGVTSEIKRGINKMKKEILTKKIKNKKP